MLVKGATDDKGIWRFLRYDYVKDVELLVEMSVIWDVVTSRSL